MKITKYLTVTSGGDARVTANRPKPRFCEAMGCRPDTEITVIRWEYL